MIIKYTVTVRNYHFNPPQQITQTEYDYYKELIKSNPKAKLNSKLSDMTVKKGLRMAAIIGLTPFVAVFTPGVIGGEIKSAINKARAKKDEDNFYAELKNIVIQSKTFSEFCSLVKNRFPFYK